MFRNPERNGSYFSFAEEVRLSDHLQRRIAEIWEISLHAIFGYPETGLEPVTFHFP